MNIAFAKIGKSILFNHKGASLGGEVEPPALLRILANNNPDKKFYLVGRSNFKTLTDAEKLELFPYDNVIDIWSEEKKGDDKITYVFDYFKRKEIKIDFAVCMIGAYGTVTIPKKINQVANPHLTAAVIEMTAGYATPIIWWLNETKIPWVNIVNDPRYTSGQSRDFFHLPKVTLSQYDYEYEHNKINSYEDQTRNIVKIPVKYSGIEKTCLYGLNGGGPIDSEKTIPFTIVLNEGKPSRYKMLKEWVLDHFENVEVYGAWEHEEALKDSRFKGLKPFHEVQKEMSRTKCTFIIPIAKGWVTSKYIEMVHAGTIPFFHPTYDEQNHLGVPKFLKPKNGKELYERVMQINNDEVLRENIICALLRMWCKVSDYNGTTINKTVMGAMIENYEAPDLKNFKQKEIDTLEAFF